MQPPVHHGLLIFRVEIPGRTDAPDDGGGFPLRRIVGQQAVVQLRRHIGQFQNRDLHQLQLLRRGKHLSFFLRVGADAHIHLIEAGRRPADNVHMPQRDGVKAP